MALNEALQKLMREWGKVSEKRNRAVMLDQASLGWFAELNRGLRDELDDVGFKARLRETTAQLKALAAEIALTALADHPQLDVSEVRALLGDDLSRLAGSLLFPESRRRSLGRGLMAEERGASDARWLIPHFSCSWSSSWAPRDCWPGCCAYFGQPAVIGEMAAGIVLGPIVFGAVAPELHAHVFEPASRGALEGQSQLGLVLFMFIVGAELRLPTGARSQMIAATWVGVPAVLLPMALGHRHRCIRMYPSMAPAGRIVLAVRAVHGVGHVDYGVSGDGPHPEGSRHHADLHRATRDDVGGRGGRSRVDSACAGRRARRHHSRLERVRAPDRRRAAARRRSSSGCSARSIAWLLSRYASDGRPAGALLAALLIGTFACAYATGYLGVHPVFGAFLFGACLPRDDRLLHSLIERIEHVAIIVLMPVFFALAGLNTTPDAFAGAGARRARSHPARGDRRQDRRWRHRRAHLPVSRGANRLR